MNCTCYTCCKCRPRTERRETVTMPMERWREKCNRVAALRNLYNKERVKRREAEKRCKELLKAALPPGSFASQRNDLESLKTSLAYAMKSRRDLEEEMREARQEIAAWYYTETDEKREIIALKRELRKERGTRTMVDRILNR